MGSVCCTKKTKKNTLQPQLQNPSVASVEKETEKPIEEYDYIDEIKEEEEFDENNSNNFADFVNINSNARHVQNTLFEGYMRIIESQFNEYYFPRVLINIIRKYYNGLMDWYKIYGIAAADRDSDCFELGKSSTVYLSSFSDLCDNQLNIFCGYKKYFIQTMYNELYLIGYNQCRVYHPSDYNNRNIDDIYEANGYRLNITYSLKNDDCISFISQSTISSSMTFIITKNGYIYTWGINNDNDSILHQPSYFTKTQYKFIKVICGSDHALFMTMSGNVFSFGSNIYGQCGFGLNQNDNNNYIDTIRHIQSLHDISAICCGLRTNLCLSKDMRVYCFGYNYCGSLGLGNETKTIDIPIEHPFFKRLDTVCIGLGKQHGLCIDSNWNGYTFGDNEYNQASFINDKHVQTSIYDPYQLKSFDNSIHNGWCGPTFTILLIKNNKNQQKLISFGTKKFVVNKNNIYKKLGIKIDKNESITRIVTGSESILFIVDRNNNSIDTSNSNNMSTTAVDHGK